MLKFLRRKSKVEVDDHGMPKCADCGTPVAIGQKFCGECGRRLVFDEKKSN